MEQFDEEPTNELPPYVEEPDYQRPRFSARHAAQDEIDVLFGYIADDLKLKKLEQQVLNELKPPTYYRAAKEVGRIMLGEVTMGLLLLKDKILRKP